MTMLALVVGVPLVNDAANALVSVLVDEKMSNRRKVVALWRITTPSSWLANPTGLVHLASTPKSVLGADWTSMGALRLPAHRSWETPPGMWNSASAPLTLGTGTSPRGFTKLHRGLSPVPWKASDSMPGAHGGVLKVPSSPVALL